MIKLPEPEGTIAYPARDYEPEWISSQEAYSESQMRQAIHDAYEEAANLVANFAIDIDDEWVLEQAAIAVRKLKEEV